MIVGINVAKITTTIDDKILTKFRDAVYNTKGLKKGDIKNALEDAMLDYVQKYNQTLSTKETAKKLRTRRKNDET
ncbi:MAG: hypothetical protein ACREAF_02750 [Nitrosopumilaceae archaeon]